MSRLHTSVSALSVVAVMAAAVSLGASAPAVANDKLVELSKSTDNWPMTGKNYNANNYSEANQVTKENVKQLRPAWSFSTGVLSGHEGTPLVVDGVMYIHSPFPNTTFAVGLDDPGKILWQHKPKQNPTARAVACCDVVNRGLAYWPGNGTVGPLIIKTQLDGHVVALDAKTGEEYWKLENSDI